MGTEASSSAARSTTAAERASTAVGLGKKASSSSTSTRPTCGTEVFTQSCSRCPKNASDCCPTSATYAETSSSKNASDCPTSATYAETSSTATTSTRSAAAASSNGQLDQRHASRTSTKCLGGAPSRSACAAATARCCPSSSPSSAAPISWNQASGCHPAPTTATSKAFVAGPHFSTTHCSPCSSCYPKLRRSSPEVWVNHPYQHVHGSAWTSKHPRVPKSISGQHARPATTRDEAEFFQRRNPGAPPSGGSDPGAPHDDDARPAHGPQPVHSYQQPVRVPAPTCHAATQQACSCRSPSGASEPCLHHFHYESSCNRQQSAVWCVSSAQPNPLSSCDGQRPPAQPDLVYFYTPSVR